MDNVSFIYGFADELEKHAVKKTLKKADEIAGRAASHVYAKGKGAAKKVVSEGARGAMYLARKGAIPALIAGIPLYFGAKAISEGFGRGVAEESDKRLPYER